MKMTDDHVDDEFWRDALHTGEQLKEYWVHGKGALKIRWGTPGDFNRCVRHLEKYVADPQGLCNTYHVAATGYAPGHAPSEQVGKHDLELDHEVEQIVWGHGRVPGEDED